MDYSNGLSIDLHIHSNASDGTLSPLEILALAQQLNLGAIAITDHDTVEGAYEALQSATTFGMRVLTGVELSASPPADFSCSGSFHILGYGINLQTPLLTATLQALQQARKNRNPQIIAKLNQLGFAVTLHEVIDEVGPGQIGRPHIARLMVAKNFAGSINEAFDKYLGRGKPAYVDKFRVDSAKAIEVIQNAGGIAVLAHPSLLNLSDENLLEPLIVSLKALGLQGLEVYYPEHTAEQSDQYIALARKHELLMTGGSDFHGSLKPSIQMGSGSGDLYIPYAFYEAINNYLKQL